MPEIVEVPAPSDEALQAVLHEIITRLMKLLTRKGVRRPEILTPQPGHDDDGL